MDQNGRRTAFEYDGLGRLTKVIDALFQETAFAYDETGNKVSQTDANLHTTEWSYDALGRLTSRTLPLGQSESMAYDGNGNLLTKTDFNGRTLSFEYDVNDRQVRKIYEDLSEEVTTYDAVGNRLSASDARGVTIFEFDARDRLVSKTDPNGTVIAYAYDAESNQVSRTLTLPGALPRVQVHTYDALNRLATVTDPDGGVTSHTYDAVGNRVEDVYPNGTVSTYTFDLNNRLVRLETDDPLGSALQRFDYALDPTGRRAQVTELDGRTVAYTYDAIYRLEEERVTPAGGGADIVNSYTYDPVGNRVFSVEDGVSTAYSYDDNDRLLTAGGLTYQYDANGNQVRVTEDSTVIDYGYDPNDRLVSAETTVSGAVTSTVTFGYDVGGNRVAKDNNGAAATFVVDTNADLAQVLAETDAADTLIVEYLHGDDLYRQLRGGAESYFHYDGLGSTRTLTDASGALTDGYQYDAWGTLLNQSGFTDNEFLFTGEQFDAELDNYYLRARYYDPKQGRFRTQDPFGGIVTEPVTLHRYLYVDNDPVNKVDPSGQIGFLIELNATSNIRAATVATQTIGTSALRLSLQKSITAIARQGAATLSKKFFRKYVRQCLKKKDQCSLLLPVLLVGADNSAAAKHITDAQLGRGSNLVGGTWVLNYLPRKRRNWQARELECSSTKKLLAMRLFNTTFVDCDEYPFFATRQGGPANHPQRVSLRYIPRLENRSVGGAFGALARISKLKRNDEILVIAGQDIPLTIPLPVRRRTR